MKPVQRFIIHCYLKNIWHISKSLYNCLSDIYFLLYNRLFVGITNALKQVILFNEGWILEVTILVFYYLIKYISLFFHVKGTLKSRIDRNQSISFRYILHWNYISGYIELYEIKKTTLLLTWCSLPPFLIFITNFEYWFGFSFSLFQSGATV